MTCAVIDTNVLVASLLTRNHDSATARVMDAVYSHRVIPILNDEIRKQVHHPGRPCTAVRSAGARCGRTARVPLPCQRECEPL